MVASVADLAQENDIEFKTVKNPCLSLCLGSVIYQSLERKIEGLLPLIDKLITNKELKYMYSGDKVQSIEDCVLFFPYIFKLKRSVLFTKIRRDKDMSRLDEKLLPVDEDDLFLDDNSTQATGREWLDDLQEVGDYTAKMTNDKFPFGVM